MNVIVVPSAFRELLAASAGEVELRDEAGNVLGFFQPQRPVGELDMTPEEITYELSPDRPTFTTAEVLAYVKGLVS